jgi:hypothetical protein
MGATNAEARVAQGPLVDGYADVPPTRGGLPLAPVHLTRSKADPPVRTNSTPPPDVHGSITSYDVQRWTPCHSHPHTAQARKES